MIDSNDQSQLITNSQNNEKEKSDTIIDERFFLCIFQPFELELSKHGGLLCFFFEIKKVILNRISS